MHAFALTPLRSLPRRNRLPLAAFIALMSLAGHADTTLWAQAHAGARRVEFRGEANCIQLENRSTRVVLGHAGGRVLEYSRDGVNALYLPEGEQGMNAGRFDIGPEQTIPAHPQLWSGVWKSEITGNRAARLTSVKDESTGVQLVRDFQLAADSSRLECRQTIHNVSNETVEYCHWSRTFAAGGGIVVIPTTTPSRFPHRYVMYTPAPVINFKPEDDKILVRDDHLQIVGAPAFPKLGFDSQAGWFAYLMKNDLMFVKQFPTYPDRVYNEVAGLTLSIWYPDRPMCELEPIGPRERIEPGKSAAFTETWSLLPHKFPANGVADYGKVRAAVQALK
ncbi:MAG: hypothetical protein KDB14_34720 [Planctomycetales bacterium]|nr:hypothetical protein [Planctomycetales bacterium]